MCSYIKGAFFPLKFITNACFLNKHRVKCLLVEVFSPNPHHHQSTLLARASKVQEVNEEVNEGGLQGLREATF